jgi:hypothetical protein
MAGSSEILMLLPDVDAKQAVLLWLKSVEKTSTDQDNGNATATSHRGKRAKVLFSNNRPLCSKEHTRPVPSSI